MPAHSLSRSGCGRTSTPASRSARIGAARAAPRSSASPARGSGGSGVGLSAECTHSTNGRSARSPIARQNSSRPRAGAAREPLVVALRAGERRRGRPAGRASSPPRRFWTSFQTITWSGAMCSSALLDRWSQLMIAAATGMLERARRLAAHRAAASANRSATSAPRRPARAPRRYVDHRVAARASAARSASSARARQPRPSRRHARSPSARPARVRSSARSRSFGGIARLEHPHVVERRRAAAAPRRTTARPRATAADPRSRPDTPPPAARPAPARPCASGSSPVEVHLMAAGRQLAHHRIEVAEVREVQRREEHLHRALARRSRAGSCRRRRR